MSDDPKQIALRLKPSTVASIDRIRAQTGFSRNAFIEAKLVEAVTAELGEIPHPPEIEVAPASGSVRDIAPTKPGEVSAITGQRFPTPEESTRRHERVLERAAEMRRADSSMNERAALTAAAHELYPRTPPSGGEIRSQAEKDAILASFHPDPENA
jgi:hypothetical protein